MATRSIIRIEYGQTNITLYRHWDGYLGEGGFDLACILKHRPTAETFIEALITCNRKLSPLEMNCPQYEIVPSDNMGEEFRYTFKFSFDGSLNIKVEKGFFSEWRTKFDEKGEVKEVAKEFYKICNEARVEIGKNLKERIQQGEMVGL